MGGLIECYWFLLHEWCLLISRHISVELNLKFLENEVNIWLGTLFCFDQAIDHFRTLVKIFLYFLQQIFFQPSFLLKFHIKLLDVIHQQLLLLVLRLYEILQIL